MVDTEISGRSLPVVTRNSTVRAALEILSDAHVRWLIVAEPDGIPKATLSGMDILRSIFPEFLLDAPKLARIVDHAEARELMSHQLNRTLGDIIDQMEHDHYRLPTVSAEPTALEIAIELIRTRSSVAYIQGSGPKDPRFATLPGLFQRLLEVLD